MALDEKNIGYQESFLDENGDIKPKFDNTKNETKKEVSNVLLNKKETKVKKNELRKKAYYTINIDSGIVSGSGKNIKYSKENKNIFQYCFEPEKIKKNDAEIKFIYEGKTYIINVIYDLEKIKDRFKNEFLRINIRIKTIPEYNKYGKKIEYCAKNENNIPVFLYYGIAERIAKHILGDYRFNKFVSEKINV